MFKKRDVDYFIYKPLILLSILQFFNIDIFISPFTAVLNALEILIIPILGIFILNFEPAQLKKSLIFFCTFIILSFLPYTLGIFTSIKSGYNLEVFGGTEGIIGPYQNPHGASIALACSLITILYFLLQGSYNRLFLGLLFILGFFYLFNTYVRTGIAMFIVGIIPILLHSGRKSIKNAMMVIIVGLIIALMLSQVISDDVLVNRLTGKSKYGSEDSIKEIGSGRVSFWMTGVHIFKETDLREKVLGLGETELLNRMNHEIGLKIVTHNAFFDLLLINGILGLFLFLLYLYKVVKLILEIITEDHILLLALLCSYIVMCLVQGYDWIFANLLLMLSIGLQNLSLSKYCN